MKLLRDTTVLYRWSLMSATHATAEHERRARRVGLFLFVFCETEKNIKLKKRGVIGNRVKAARGGVRGDERKLGRGVLLTRWRRPAQPRGAARGKKNERMTRVWKQKPRPPTPTSWLFSAKRLRLDLPEERFRKRRQGGTSTSRSTRRSRTRNCGRRNTNPSA